MYKEDQTHMQEEHPTHHSSCHIVFYKL